MGAKEYIAALAATALLFGLGGRIAELLLS
jgi:hypothetical protein